VRKRVAKDQSFRSQLSDSAANKQMLSDTECNSINEAIESLSQALNSLVSRQRAGIELGHYVIAVTEALEKLEDLLPEEILEAKETEILAPEAMHVLNDSKEFEARPISKRNEPHRE